MFVLEAYSYGIAGFRAFMHCIYGYLHEQNILKFEQFLFAKGERKRMKGCWVQ